MVNFDETTHTYTLDGKNLISVTQLMNFYNLGVDYGVVNQATLKASAERGTLIHKEIETYNKEGVLGFTDEVLNYADYLKDHNTSCLESEFMVNDDTVAGTIDLILLQQAEKIIADIKTTSTVHKDSVSWQLSIYRYLYWKVTGELIKKGLVFHFDKSHKLRVVEIPLKPIEEVEKLIQAYKDNTIYAVTELDKKNLKKVEKYELLILGLKQKIAEYEIASKQIKDALLEKMEEVGCLKLETDNLKITYIAEQTRATIDTKKLKEDLPEIAEKYTKETKVKATLKITPKGAN